MRSILTNRLFQLGAATLVVAGMGYMYFDSNGSSDEAPEASDVVSETTSSQDQAETTSVSNTASGEETETPAVSTGDNSATE